MKQELFERAREERWRRFEALLDAPPRAARDEDFPRRYRVLCQDLALAQDRGFDAALVERLNALALRGHQRFYGARGHPVRPIEFLARGFPAAVRREARIIGWISLLFFGSMTLFFALDVTRPTLIYHLLSGAQVVQFEEMYDPTAAHYGAPRDTAGDFAAFAYYVGNNVGVAFRTFAWGLFFGVGSLLLVLFNGVVLGLLLYLYGRAMRVRVVPTFVGGEDSSSDALWHVSGPHFYETIRRLPALKWAFGDASAGVFDVYRLVGRYGDTLVQRLRTWHTGLVAAYASWVLIGLVVLVVALALG